MTKQKQTNKPQKSYLERKTLIVHIHQRQSLQCEKKGQQRKVFWSFVVANFFNTIDIE